MDEKDNNNNNTPSTGSNVMPTGGGSIGQAAKQKAKNTAKKGFDAIKGAAKRGLKALWAFLPLHVKVIVIVVIIIAIIIIAALTMGMISQSSTVTRDSVNSYVSSSKDLDEDTKSLYNDKASLIKFKITDINKMYDKFVKDANGGAETQTLMKYEIGSNNVSADSRIVSVEDKEPLYKHIMMTEKYNFNSVKWQKFSHKDTAGTNVKEFVENKDLGLKYPDDSKNEAGGKETQTKLEKFIDLTLPYLQTWYIPLAMSNASVINGKEDDSSRAPAFSYNIIKEAYSNVIVNWYELKKHTEVTQYHTYDKITRHDILYNVVVTESQQRTGTSDDNPSYETTGYSVDSSNITCVTNNDTITHVNTATENGLQDGTRDPMKEDLVSANDEYTSTYYIKEADVFDAKIINEFNHEVYLDSDAKNRQNPDSSNEASATWTRTGDDIQNKYDSTGVSCDNNGNLKFNGGRASVKSYGGDNAVTTDYPDRTRRINHTYTVDLEKYTEYENGLEHIVTRVWKDKLEQTDSKTSEYTIDDLLMYNQSDDRKKQVSEEDFCGNSYSADSSSSSTSTGTSKAAKNIKVGDYTYPVFSQSSYQTTTSHGGETISQAGCGLCSLTTVVASITGKSVDPVSVGNDTTWKGPKSLQEITDDLKNVYKIPAELYRWENKNDKSSVDDKISLSKQKIEEALKNNNPVIVLLKEKNNPLLSSEAHYIALVGMKDGKAIIANSAGGGLEQEYSLDYIVPLMYNQANRSECGFIIAKRGATPSSQVTIPKDALTSLSTSTSTTTSSTKKGTGEASSSNVNSTGYTGIFNSGTTGRSFKEYKQNADYAYPSVNAPLFAGWGSECGTVSVMIVGSGYSDKANFSDMKSKMISTGGGTQFSTWLKSYSGNDVKEIASPSKSQLQKLLSDGCVGVVHIMSYSSRGHFIAILDSRSNGNEIYISNPDTYFAGGTSVAQNVRTGWRPISVLYTNGNKLSDCYFVANKGSVPKYSGDDSSSDSSSDSSTTCNGTDSAKYYNTLKKTDGLNRIDFMNSNPDIFSRYIRDGAEYYEYVGYSRSKLSLSYWNLKRLFQDIYDKKGSLPWAYGKTLGFENIYSSSFSNESSASGIGIFTWPVPEYVKAGIKMQDQLTAHFAGNDSVHNGNHGAIDIVHSTNTSATIVAAGEGTVIIAENSTQGSTYPNGPQTYGNYVVIDHGNGYFTLYGHMRYNSITVNAGDKVKKRSKDRRNGKHWIFNWQSLTF